MTNCVVSDILDSDKLPIIFHMLDRVKIRKIHRLGTVSKPYLWINITQIWIKSGIEADKAARDFTASIASAYRLSTNKITLSDINNDIPGLDRLL
jgi:hypothetical protein